MRDNERLTANRRQTICRPIPVLGLCLLAMPLTGLAQSTNDARDVTMFTPNIGACITTPAGAECAEQQELLAQCAVDLDQSLCAPLFDAPDSVFEDPAKVLAAQMMLTEASAALRPTESSAPNRDAGSVPELSVLTVSEDYPTAPDPVRTLDARQQRLLERLMSDPEVAASVARFTEGADDAERVDTAPSVYPQALFALKRAQQGSGSEGDATAPVDVIEGMVAAEDLRQSSDASTTRAVLEFDAEQIRSDGDSELDRAGLGSLARLAVGMQIKAGRVAARTDERVVIRLADADPVLWHDDDTNLRDAQSQRWIERFEDGSTLSRWQRADGTWTMSVRDVTGRVPWRERILMDGSSVQIISDLEESEPVELSVLPAAVWRELRVTADTDPVLAMALLQQAEEDLRSLGRNYTLRQVRETKALRDLVPVLGPVSIPFAVNSANLTVEDAGNLAGVGNLMVRLIAENPREVFLIEGHTDGTGLAVHNLVLSDRRAESIALALTETFAIPPENLIFQGYGKRHLRIPTAAGEAGNRRVEIRRISTLLGR